MATSVTAAHPPDEPSPRRSEAEPLWEPAEKRGCRIASRSRVAGTMSACRVGLIRSASCSMSSPLRGICCPRAGWFLAGHRRELFPDELFADLFAAGRGRPSVPVEQVASVLVLQTLHNLSDR